MPSTTATNFWFVPAGLAVTVRGGNPVLYTGDITTRKINIAISGTPSLTPFSENKLIENPNFEQVGGVKKAEKTPNYIFSLTIDNDQYKFKWQDLVLGDPKIASEVIDPTPTSTYLLLVEYFATK